MPKAPPQLQFFGATRQVTGSQYCLRTDGEAILVDCGMFQERAFLERNWTPPPLPASRIRAVLLTHAHIDHCGLLPRLVHAGFRGQIYATSATRDLAALVLQDSAQIQAEDAAFKAKRHRKEGRKGRYDTLTLFTLDDVARTMHLFRTVAYGEPVKINGCLSARFLDAGHILGSAMIECSLANGSPARRLIFSGDIGQWDRPILRDPTVFAEADYVVMESTYGTREHENNVDLEGQLGRILDETIRAGGNLVVPVFAIERTQELLFHLGRLLHSGRVPNVPVFLDSPMAEKATQVFARHEECYDAEMAKAVAAGQSPWEFPGLRMIHSVEESQALNDRTSPAVILATSGMCVAGRIKHHLAHNVSRPESTILFVGYQARGSLGRQILDGAEEVRIHGRYHPMRARVAEIRGFSGHLDRPGLLRWLSSLASPPRRMFLTHGEEESSLGLAEYLRQEKGWTVDVPTFGQSVVLEG
jgi:metallo-beta-lactamase family protein